MEKGYKCGRGSKRCRGGRARSKSSIRSSTA
jgi:hypothetical protein